MLKLGYSFTSTWFLSVISLFLFIGLCWVPVVIIQYKLRNIADESLAAGILKPSFNKLMRLWIALGVPAFLSILAIFWLMVFKPLAVT